jgi:predicted ATP-grasp superfamily ATP-dependent carboligase
VSLLFVAGAAGVRVVGCQRLLTTTVGDRRHVFAGVIGPLALPAAAERALLDAASALAPAFGVRGLASLDALLLADDAITVLELNARPPASLALYPEHGLLSAHLAACGIGTGVLPTPTGTPLRGTEIVYARRPLHVAGAPPRPGVHDWPAADSRFEPGQPVCSLSACGSDADALRATLAASRDALLDELESSST